MSFHDQFEMINQSFDISINIFLIWEMHHSFVCHKRPFRHFVCSLFNYADALSDFFHPDQKSIKTITCASYRNFKIKFIINRIRIRPPDIIRYSTGPQQWPGKTKRKGIFFRDSSNIFYPINENFIASEKFVTFRHDFFQFG